MRRVTVATLLFLAGELGAQKVPPRPAFELKGFAFADPPKKEGRFRCQDMEVQTVKLKLCIDLGASIVGVATTQSRTYFRDQLMSYDISFSSDDYETIADAFRTKYGAPDETQRNTLQNRMGATFQNETLSWVFADGIATLSKYGSKVTQGKFSANATAFAEVFGNAQPAVADQAAKDLGPPVKR